MILYIIIHFFHLQRQKNTRFDVKFDFMKGIIHCHFISERFSQDKTNKSCSLVYGVMQNFVNSTNSLRNRNTSIENFTISNQDSVIIPLGQISTVELVYCFIAKGTVMMKTTAIEGTFKCHGVIEVTGRHIYYYYGVVIFKH